MGRRNDHKGQLVNTLFTMLLFLVFVLCALFAVLIGGKVYENINARTESTYRGDVALSYIANKVRQGDADGMVGLTEMEGINGSEYVTYIYYRDGKLWELFTDTESGLGVNDGYEILECDEVVMSMDGGLFSASTSGDGGGRIWLSLRSGG